MFRNGILSSSGTTVSLCHFVVWHGFGSVPCLGFHGLKLFLNGFPNRNYQFLLISFSLSFFFDHVPKRIAISFVIKNLLVNCVLYICFL